MVPAPRPSILSRTGLLGARRHGDGPDKTQQAELAIQGPHCCGYEPVFSFVVAFGSDALAAFAIDHQKPHPVEPPVEAASVELGAHIAQVCRGCHGEHLSGGKIAGDPNMPLVANLTPHELA